MILGPDNEPLFTWKKFLSWKTVFVFVIIIGGFSLGYYTQTFFHNRGDVPDGIVTTSGEPPADSNDDPYIIDFSHQGLLEFPEYLLDRPEITNLILSFNSIPAIPDGISSMERLRVLDIRYNQLSGPMSAELTSLGLVDLNLSHNQIDSLPNQLSQMTSLRYIDLSHNNISQIPQGITELQGLKWLNVEGNNVPANVVEQLRDAMPSTIIND